MSEIFKKAQEMQQRMQEAQKDLAGIKAEGSAGGGVVKATANGLQEIVNLEIAPDLMTAEDREMLEEMVVAAVNQALKAAKEAAAKHMQGQTGDLFGGLLSGMNIPGM